MKILHVVGARPNFMKLSPVHRRLADRGVHQFLVHTGQHYDRDMSAQFFEDLELPEPDVDLGVGSGTHAEQTAAIMTRIEPVLAHEAPAWTVVYGDVNSTVAAALVATKLGLPVVHVEAGLRSRDRSMPEELNRIVTDRLADLLLTPSRDASDNLAAEGEDPERIVFVGNVMIDTLLRIRERMSDRSDGFRGELPEEYVLVTLHRPSNVDDPDRLREILRQLGRLARRRPVVFPVHPRTMRRIESLDLRPEGVRFHDPFGYPQMVAAMSSATAVLTDSGGVQEETSVLGIPCVTLRPNTERPVTVGTGTNRVEPDPRRAVDLLTEPREVEPMVLEGWDGRAGERVADSLLDPNRLPAMARSADRGVTRD